MQALTIAISSSGLQYLAPKLIGGQLAKALSGLVPPGNSIPVPDILLSTSPDGTSSTVAEKISVSLGNGSISNLTPTVQSMTQGANGQFTFVLVATNLTVHYSWNERYEEHLITGKDTFLDYQNKTWPYSVGLDSLTVTVPITVAQQADAYTLTFGTILATASAPHANIPSDSIVQHETCFIKAVDDTTMQALEAIDFQTPIRNLFQNLFTTIPASGQLTPDIVFHFNQGDTKLAFPVNQGLTLGVTGNVTWKGNAYPDGTPPSLGIPSVPAANHVHFYASAYQFNELYWAFFKDGRLGTTVTGATFPILARSTPATTRTPT